MGIASKLFGLKCRKDPRIDALNQELAELKEKHLSLQQRYEILTENLAASVSIRDPYGKLAYSSPYTLVLTGYSLEEIYSQKDDFFLSITHPEDQDSHSKAIKITAQGEPHQTRFRIIHKTGIEVWVEMRTAPIFGESSEVEGVLAVILDVTSQVRYQRQIEERTRDLHDLSYMISHDLRSPVLTIKGMIDILRQDLEITGPAQETFTHMKQAVQRLEDLIGSVLNYFRLASEEAQRERFKINALLKDVENDLQIAKDAAKAQIIIQDNSISIESDRLKCYRILSNLVSNSIKYRHHERPLLINIELKISSSSRDILISVKDNGSGIPAEKLSSIFRPFQRAHGKQIEGFGVGLASVKKLIQALGGNIEVSSIEGEGSIFTVILRNCSPQS